jgi:hypothetical protein
MRTKRVSRTTDGAAKASAALWMTRSESSTAIALCLMTSSRARRAGTTHSGSYVALSTSA